MATAADLQAAETLLDQSQARANAPPTDMERDFLLLAATAQTRIWKQGLRRDWCTDRMTRDSDYLAARIRDLRHAHDQYKAKGGLELEAFELEYDGDPDLRQRMLLTTKDMDTLPESILLARGMGARLREAEGQACAMHDASVYVSRETASTQREYALVADWWSRAVIGRHMSRKAYVLMHDQVFLRTVYDPIHPLSFRTLDAMSERLAALIPEEEGARGTQPPKKTTKPTAAIPLGVRTDPVPLTAKGALDKYFRVVPGQYEGGRPIVESSWNARLLNQHRVILTGNQDKPVRDLAVLKIRQDLRVRAQDRAANRSPVMWVWKRGSPSPGDSATTFASDLVLSGKLPWASKGVPALTETLVKQWSEADAKDRVATPLTAEEHYDGPDVLWQPVPTAYWLVRERVEVGGTPILDQGRWVPLTDIAVASPGTLSYRGYTFPDTLVSQHLLYAFPLARRLAMAGDPDYGLKFYWLTVYHAFKSNLSEEARLDRVADALGVWAHSQGKPMIFNMNDRDDRALYYSIPFTRSEANGLLVTNPVELDNYFFGPGAETRAILSFAQRRVTPGATIPIPVFKTFAMEVIYTRDPAHPRGFFARADGKKQAPPNVGTEGLTWYGIALMLDTSSEMKAAHPDRLVWTIAEPGYAERKNVANIRVDKWASEVAGPIIRRFTLKTEINVNEGITPFDPYYVAQPRGRVVSAHGIPWPRLSQFQASAGLLVDVAAPVLANAAFASMFLLTGAYLDAHPGSTPVNNALAFIPAMLAALPFATGLVRYASAGIVSSPSSISSSIGASWLAKKGRSESATLSLFVAPEAAEAELARDRYTEAVKEEKSIIPAVDTRTKIVAIARPNVTAARRPFLDFLSTLLHDGSAYDTAIQQSQEFINQVSAAPYAWMKELVSTYSGASGSGPPALFGPNGLLTRPGGLIPACLNTTSRTDQAAACHRLGELWPYLVNATQQVTNPPAFARLLGHSVPTPDPLLPTAPLDISTLAMSPEDAALTEVLASLSNSESQPSSSSPPPPPPPEARAASVVEVARPASIPPALRQATDSDALATLSGAFGEEAASLRMANQPVSLAELARFANISGLLGSASLEEVKKWANTFLGHIGDAAQASASKDPVVAASVGGRLAHDFKRFFTRGTAHSPGVATLLAYEPILYGLLQWGEGRATRTLTRLDKDGRRVFLDEQVAYAAPSAWFRWLRDVTRIDTQLMVSSYYTTTHWMGKDAPWWAGAAYVTTARLVEGLERALVGPGAGQARRVSIGLVRLIRATLRYSLYYFAPLAAVSFRPEARRRQAALGTVYFLSAALTALLATMRAYPGPSFAAGIVTGLAYSRNTKGGIIGGIAPMLILTLTSLMPWIEGGAAWIATLAGYLLRMPQHLFTGILYILQWLAPAASPYHSEAAMANEDFLWATLYRGYNVWIGVGEKLVPLRERFWGAVSSLFTGATGVEWSTLQIMGTIIAIGVLFLVFKSLIKYGKKVWQFVPPVIKPVIGLLSKLGLFDYTHAFTDVLGDKGLVGTIQAFYRQLSEILSTSNDTVAAVDRVHFNADEAFKLFPDAHAKEVHDTNAFLQEGKKEEKPVTVVVPPAALGVTPLALLPKTHDARFYSHLLLPWTTTPPPLADASTALGPPASSWNSFAEDAEAPIRRIWHHERAWLLDHDSDVELLRVLRFLTSVTL
jgi:hypothetical protein